MPKEEKILKKQIKGTSGKGKSKILDKIIKKADEKGEDIIEINPHKDK